MAGRDGQKGAERERRKKHARKKTVRPGGGLGRRRVRRTWRGVGRAWKSETYVSMRSASVTCRMPVPKAMTEPSSVACEARVGGACRAVVSFILVERVSGVWVEVSAVLVCAVL